jgi:glycosyltransferase involved in cell wall biosynthesis
MIMQVLYDHQIFSFQDYGGISRYFYELAIRLSVRAGVNVQILAPLHCNRYLIEGASHLVRGVEIPKLKRGANSLLWLNTQLSRLYLGRRMPDILHETYYSSWDLSRRRTRVVITVHDMIHEKFPTLLPRAKRVAAIKQRAIRRADHIICISENTRLDLLEYYNLPEEKVSVVYLGYAFRGNKATPERRPKPYLLYVGSREGYKNFARLLRAYASTSFARDIDLICFGGGAFTFEERQLIAALKCQPDQVVTVQGNDTSLSGYYQGALAFVYPSLYEGFGFPPLEAMGFSCPVVCSNRGSLREVVGDAAQCFDPEDEQSIAVALEAVVGNPACQERLRCLGAQRVHRFRWEDCAERTYTIYRQLLEGN